MTSFNVEYLITVDQDELFCNSKEALTNFLNSMSSIKILPTHIEFENIKVKYSIENGELAKDAHNHSYFHIKLSFDIEEKDETVFDSKLKAFENLNRDIKKGLVKINKDANPPSILWDDISLFYAQKAYPLIYEFENIMRKLFTKFMLVNVGLGWAKDNIPQKVVDSIKIENNAKDDRIKEYNPLYEVDFIQLSKFLFDKYDNKAILEKIKKAKKIEEFSLADLQELIAKSNWERYFSNVIVTDEGKLETNLQELYKKRNKIAHNKIFGRADFERTIALLNEVKPKLEDALKNLDKVQVPQAERETVAEHSASIMDKQVALIIGTWSEIEYILIQISELTKKSTKQLYRLSFRQIIEESEHFNTALKVNLLQVRDFRNLVVHRTPATERLTEQDLESTTRLAQKCLKELYQIYGYLLDKDKLPKNPENQSSIEELEPNKNK